MATREQRRKTAEVGKPLALETWDLIDRTVEVVGQSVPTADTEAMRLSMTLRTASNVMFYDIHAELRQMEGISAATLNILLVLQVDGELEFTRLAKFAGMTKPTASALINSMVSQGLLARRGDEADGRRSLLSATADGAELCTRATALLNLREVYWAEGLTAPERVQLIALLDKLITYRLSDIDVRQR